ncbi:MAG: cytochrome b [Sphingomicrobium sp.]
MTDQTRFDTATRIVAGDDGTTYDGVAIALHWATALLVVVQFGLAETWDWFAKPTSETTQSLHISLGVLLTAVILTRIAWRLLPGHQLSALEAGWVRLASKAGHYLLYVLLVAQAALGFAFRWSQGHPVGFFGLPIPGPYGQLDRPMRHQLHDLHKWLGWAIVLLALLHALAALYHHYVLKDRVLVRMLPRGAR